MHTCLSSFDSCFCVVLNVYFVCLSVSLPFSCFFLSLSRARCISRPNFSGFLVTSFHCHCAAKVRTSRTVSQPLLATRAPRPEEGPDHRLRLSRRCWVSRSYRNDARMCQDCRRCFLQDSEASHQTMRKLQDHMLKQARCRSLQHKVLNFPGVFASVFVGRRASYAPTAEIIARSPTTQHQRLRGR